MDSLEDLVEAAAGRRERLVKRDVAGNNAVDLHKEVALRRQGLFEQVPSVIRVKGGDGLVDGRDFVGADLLAVLPLARLGREGGLGVSDVLRVGLDLLAEGLDLGHGLALRQPPRRTLDLHGDEGVLGFGLLLILGIHQHTMHLDRLRLLGGRVLEARLELGQQARQGLLDVARACPVLFLERGLAVELLPILHRHLPREDALQENDIGLGEAVASNLENQAHRLGVRLPGLDGVAAAGPQPQQASGLRAFVHDVDGLHQGGNRLVHLGLRRLVVGLLLGAQCLGLLDVGGVPRDLLFQIHALRRQLDAACVQILDVRLQLLLAGRGRGIGLGFLADDGLGPTLEGLEEVLLGLQLVLDFLAEALQQLHHPSHGAQAVRRRQATRTDDHRGQGSEPKLHCCYKRSAVPSARANNLSFRAGS
mmetsp:Transcript_162419/g.516015  ORF Transcript_162419/g.516015 Transcript_162419/m.516015 type:complete len:421 (-) Transcript_162419:40-1302(-)